MELATTYMTNRIQSALETCDVEELMHFYTDDAVIRVFDKDHPPSAPLEVQGRAALQTFFKDICSRDMTHHIDMEIVDASHLAFTESCQYKDGTRVLSNSLCELRNGRIAKETIVQVWDI